jgi:hypothetical protein
MTTPFTGWPKIARFNREVIITEKIDGTNAQIHIEEDGSMLVGSRTRWITPADDNFGFARWCEQNRDDLLKLGPGSHFGEWWGCGIQRGYHLSERRFSLFNAVRWRDGAPEKRPDCCRVVPVLAEGLLRDIDLENVAHQLRIGGSVAAPDFDGLAEGFVIYHKAAQICFKVLLEGDDKRKGE